MSDVNDDSSRSTVFKIKLKQLLGVSVLYYLNSIQSIR